MDTSKENLYFDTEDPMRDGQGGVNFPHPVAFTSGYCSFFGCRHLMVPFLLQDNIQCWDFFLFFSRFPPPWKSYFPPPRLLSPIESSPPLLSGSPSPCPYMQLRYCCVCLSNRAVVLRFVTQVRQMSLRWDYQSKVSSQRAFINAALCLHA